jgi:electron transfer flavoprotein beta subunit
MRVLVCVKRVPLTGGKINLTEDEQAIQTRHLGFTVSPHEECGAEEAVRLVEARGGESVALTLGPAEAEEQLRDLMAIGIDRGIHLLTDGSEWDPQATAGAIVAAIGAEPEPFDLILFGTESADAGNYQVAIRVAYALGLPVVNGIKAIAVSELDSHPPTPDRPASLRCEREVSGGRDVYAVALPAVVTVMEGINLPRYPSVPGRMRAKRKPVAASEPAKADAKLKMVRLVLPEASGKQVEILGSGTDAAPRVVEILQEIGVL